MALHASPPPTSRFLFGAGLGMGLAMLGMVGRKLMVQAPTMLAGDWNRALEAEHEATLSLFDRLARTQDDATARRALLLMQLKHALGKHAIEEENAVYPAMRQHGMKEEADALNADHGYVKQYLYELSDLVGDNAAFQTKLAAFRADIEQHMRQEEDELFPRLKRALDEAATSDLTRRMNQEGLKLA
ncbi:hemerythrin domain-containing protein [Sphingobium sp.]|uniref:hemerythrin domain-containing protein n=1 Tax=Sphingobium sp. TaxID=1912891 RepID=UPI002CCD2159|nr:hemerythrin domain-containing protein [Sphingobium sp.]HUD93353.1 hemerythrin domain-containing protein [Sphingobium sp.]